MCWFWLYLLRLFVCLDCLCSGVGLGLFVLFLFWCYCLDLVFPVSLLSCVELVWFQTDLFVLWFLACWCCVCAWCCWCLLVGLIDSCYFVDFVFWGGTSSIHYVLFVFVVKLFDLLGVDVCCYRLGVVVWRIVLCCFVLLVMLDCVLCLICALVVVCLLFGVYLLKGCIY